MVLSDKEIKRLIEEEDLIINKGDLTEEQLQNTSLDLKLGHDFAYIKQNSDPVIDVRKELEYTNFTVEDHVIIQPHSFMLATTTEILNLPKDITAFVEGRSSIGRLGLFSENAGWVDANFQGQITLELFNATNKPIKLYPGMRICQLVFAKTNEVPETVYNGKYQGQTGATGSQISRDNELEVV